MQNKIIIIGHSKEILLHIQFILEQNNNFDIYSTQDAHQGLKMISNIHPDLILLDLEIPKLSEFDFMKNLKSNPKNRTIPVIFLSTKAESEQKLRAFELGAVDYIRKPFNAEELIAKANTQIKISNLQKQLQTANEMLEQRVLGQTLELENEIKLRKKTEQTLKESQERLIQITDNIPVFVSLVNKRLKYIFVNQKYELFFNKSKKEIIGHTINDITGTEAFSRNYRNLIKAAKGQLSTFDNTLFDKKGTKKTFQTTYLPFYENNKVKGIITLGIDITELKKSENLLRQTQKELKKMNLKLEQKVEERTKELLFINKELIKSQNLFKDFINYSIAWETFRDVAGKLIYCTPAFEKILGYKLADFMKGRVRMQNIVHPEDIELYNETYKRILAGKNYENYEFRIITKEKKIKYLSQNVNQVFDKEGNRLGFRTGIIDITEQKKEKLARIAAEKRVFNAIIETEEKERVYFASELHDGIGPLLSNIKMCLEWIKRPESKTPKEKIYKKMDYSIQEAVSSIKEISYRLSPHILTNFGLVFALKSFSEKINALYGNLIFFHTNLNKRLKEKIEITVYRALLECINNTLKHANATKIEIEMMIINNSINISYHDNGEGFDVEKISKEQKGLGLFNIKNRITTLGGNFTIVSSLNNGVKIWFDLAI